MPTISFANTLPEVFLFNGNPDITWRLLSYAVMEPSSSMTSAFNLAFNEMSIPIKEAVDMLSIDKFSMLSAL